MDGITEAERESGRWAGMFRMLRWLFLVGLAWGAVTNLPGLARYLRMRAM